MQTIKREIIWNGRTLSIETGYLAKQANGSVLVRYGDTIILACVCVNEDVALEVDFVPLSVHYVEKAFSAGKIPGGFFKREGKATEREILGSRLIDRSLRPTIIENFNYEIQLVVTVLSYDQDTDVDIVALIAASSALQISGVPTNNIVAGCRVSRSPDSNSEDTNDFVTVNGDKELLDLVVAGSKNGILMVESQAAELTEVEILSAIQFGYREFQPLIEVIEAFKSDCKPVEICFNNLKIDHSITQRVWDLAFTKLLEIYQCKRTEKKILKDLYAEVISEFGDLVEHKSLINLTKSMSHTIFREQLLKTKVRIDGRSPTDIRDISIDLDFLPKVHGSAIFTRGRTQALVTVTLGTMGDEQVVDSLDKEYRERFMLHYNFPAYSVGEVSKMAPPGRREIGHGRLAWRAFNSVIPKHESDFPYTIRVVSDILESDGSSSMATVCGTSLALMSTGVNIKGHVAGIAMGLVIDEENASNSVILSDINGDEDHFGDMDFKVAGTQNGITALQMDIKTDQISFEIIRQALTQSVVGYQFILKKMNRVIPSCCTQLKNNVPKFKVLQITKNKICKVIGTGGKVIRSICDDFNVKIDVSDEGMVRIFSTDQDGIDAAYDKVQEITAVPEVGKVYQGVVSKLKAAGAIVQFLGNNDGWLHISELSNKHVASINNVLKERQKLYVKVIGYEDSGRINLTIKGVKQGL